MLLRSASIALACTCAASMQGLPPLIEARDAKKFVGKAGVAAVRQWRLKPGTLRGEVVSMIVVIELTFTLK